MERKEMFEQIQRFLSRLEEQIEERESLLSKLCKLVEEKLLPPEGMEILIYEETDEDCYTKRYYLTHNGVIESYSGFCYDQLTEGYKYSLCEFFEELSATEIVQVFETYLKSLEKESQALTDELKILRNIVGCLKAN